MLGTFLRSLACVALLAASSLAAMQSAPSQDATEAAIRRGVEFLLSRQNRDGSWDAEMHERNVPHHDYRNGPTALCLYTLVKCKVPHDHPAIRRALAYLLQVTPERTYSLSVQIQALAALEDEAHRPRIEALVKRLLDIRVERRGGWEYPGLTTGLIDLSNTQYAALGLRSAMQAGVKVPLKVWSDVANGVFAFQEKPRSVDVALAAGETGTGKREVAGFAYKTDRSSAPTGSMTAAGVATLTIATQALGKQIDGDLARKAERARAQGLAWLETKWSVDANPDGDSVWLFYYLYGVERIASLLGLERIGAHDWYAEGATRLLKLQKDDGSWSRDFDTTWPPQPFANGNTCFALLFLTRATAPRTGENRAVEPAIFTAEDPRHDISIRAAGAQVSRLLVTAFGVDAVAHYGHAGADAKTLHVAAVRWFVDGELAKEFPFSPPRPWKDERFAYEHAFTRNGPHVVECRVEVVLPQELATADESTYTLASPRLEVVARDLLEDWMLDYASSDAKNLLARVARVAKATSQRSDRFLPGDACDGLQFTAWVAADGDAAATWSLELDKPVRAKSVLLSQAAANATQFAAFGRIARVAITINDGRPQEFALAAAPLEKTTCAFAKSELVKRLSIRVLALAPDGPTSGGGFAEVELR
ncbi:MAG: terpene cyclase/mutase family protein [Planctomycetes bacterium]|nr:terpene cyclase/mutase family protein [Planctomycetota bacterium]